MDNPTPNTGNVEGAASRYEKLAMDREHFLTRAREASKLTIPSLFPPEGHESSNNLYRPFQSLGARGVNNLASRLLMSLFPTNTPFSRFKIDEMGLRQEMESNPELKTQIDEALAKAEQAIQNEIETKAFRKSAFQVLKQLVVGGNTLVHTTKDNGLKVYKLHNYVVNRDHEGNLLEIILKQQVSPKSLPEEYRQYCKSGDAPDAALEKNVALYTWIKLSDNVWDVHQEVQNVIILDTVGTYKKDELPWNPLRWTEIQGENYGRGHCEELQGDLQSLEGLRQAIVEGSAAAAKVLFLLNPNGTTRAAALAKTANGGFAEGRKDDVTTLQLEKFNDFRVAQETSEEIKDSLQKAFLLNSSIQRSGERVTATEWRYMIEELESALGGVYATLSQTFQLPLVNNIVSNLQAKKKFPKFPKDLVRPVIVTGLEALGRSNDLAKLDQFVAEMGQILGPEAIRTYLNPSEFLRRRATSLGIDMKNLIRSEAEVQQSQQEQQKQAAMQSIAPQLTKGMADLAKTNVQVQSKTPTQE